ncbi:ABC transporter ATP-binding protein [Aureibacillus halotolerans]|uniref:ABC-2 type transport system ATP-binding protein n=1 Tax=Aureibacillus halotolerans TaxID=1508390 RepID=A0A4R6UHF4_9BACI|nr:ABC transporter ATP-binding protein [Aureibacillus halotolerans]TDQ42584.1 ABC-2 type transport system ATP-binding protein [Aureibacillus halotolerans]
MIDVHDVKCTIGVKKANLTVGTGEVFGLLGPNGAGKSTLLSVLATLHKPTQGRVTVQGVDLIKQPKLVRPMIGYVPQDIALWEHLTVKENVRLWMGLAKSKRDKTSLLGLYEELGLSGLLHKKVRHLSGGMKRKLNLLVALLHDPSVLLLDEPTVGIDLPAKHDINEWITKRAKEGMTVLYTTHDMHEILTVCTRFAMMSHGEITFTGTHEEAFNLANSQSAKIETYEEAIFHLMRQSS